MHQQHPRQGSVRQFLVACLFTAGITLFVAGIAVANHNPNHNPGPPEKVTICHATGSQSNPYVTITVDADGLNGHGDHSGDIIPAPQGGCPSGQPPVDPPDDPPSNEKVTICHATGSQSNPYVTITADANGLNGHGDHSGDIIPAPQGGCPSGEPPVDPPVDPPSNDKVTICHATGSESNPYTTITVDANGLNGHGDHSGDIIPAPESGCRQALLQKSQKRRQRLKSQKPQPRHRNQSSLKRHLTQVVRLTLLR